MLAKGILAVAGSVAIIVYAIVTDPLPGLVTAIAVTPALAGFIRHRRRTGHWPSSWQEWERRGTEVSRRSSILQTVFGLGIVLVGFGAPDPTVRSVALALAGAVCLAFATMGLSLILNDRRRPVDESS